jgi:hypothetical protein
MFPMLKSQCTDVVMLMIGVIHVTIDFAIMILLSIMLAVIFATEFFALSHVKIITKN